MKKILVFSFLVAIGFQGFSQQITRHNVYFELGGASFFYSVNYEYLILDNTETNVAFRLGGMFLPWKDGRYISGVPVGFSWLKKLRKNYFELGLSGAVLYDTYPLNNCIYDDCKNAQDLIFLPGLRSGIRHQPSANGFFWNVVFQLSTGFVYDLNADMEPEISVYPMLGVGVGYSFL